jgi:hypothetical protein
MDVGDRQNIEHLVYDPFTDPPVLAAATVAILVTAPDGTTSTPAITNPSLGTYRTSFTLSLAGTWYWRWTVSGAVVDVADGQVTALPPAPVAYATLADFKARRSRTDTADDDALTQALVAASRSIDAMTGREPGGFWLSPAVSARAYPVIGRAYCDAAGEWLITDELGSTAGLIVEVGDGTTWTAVAGYQTGPVNALVKQRPINRLGRALSVWSTTGYGQVRVTGRWGWPSVPAQITEATLIQANRIYLRKDSPEGVAGSSEWGVMRLARTDPDVAALTAPFELAGFA